MEDERVAMDTELCFGMGTGEQLIFVLNVDLAWIEQKPFLSIILERYEFRDSKGHHVPVYVRNPMDIWFAVRSQHIADALKLKGLIRPRCNVRMLLVQCVVLIPTAAF